MASGAQPRIDPDSLFDALVATAAPVASPETGRFVRPRVFWVKAAILLATTLAFVPVLLLRDVFVSGLYVALLIVVHLAGIAVLVVGTRRHDLAPSRAGLWMRLAALGFLVLLLGLLAPGLRTSTGAAFWGLLGLVWVLHTAGLLVLHVRGRTDALCPFVPEAKSPAPA